eukprot:Hpha_TRINITY_DN15648_c2_g4::TRINITY_DN15648_c2_g4_i1::g.99760::m.99760
MAPCCRWGWWVRQGDTPDEARTKTMLFPFALFMLLFCVFNIIIAALTINQIVNMIGQSVAIFSLALFLVGVLTNAIPVTILADMLLVFATVAICVMDLGGVTRNSPFRSWALVVLALDCCLVFKRFHIPRFIIPFVLVYQAALQV